MHIIRYPAFRWFLSLVLLALIGYQLWSKSSQLENLDPRIFSESVWYLVLVIALMPVNWLLETKKWHGFLSIHANVSFNAAFKAVTSGIALSLFTPNRIGEYGGRIIVLPYGIRWPVALSTFMGSISQNLVGFTAGVIALMFLFDNSFFRMAAPFIIIIAFVCFFRIKKVVEFICRIKLHPLFLKLAGQLTHLQDYSNDLFVKSIFLALTRYIVYVTQFVLLLHVFEPEASILTLYFGVSCLYLFNTLVPLPPVADVLARTNIAFLLWAGSGMSELSISMASFMVWSVNLLIPAILGSLVIGTNDLKKSFNTYDQHFSSTYRPLVTEQPEG